MNPADLRYTKEHEWLRIEGDQGTVGITQHAQQQLGDVVYVDLPSPGDRLDAGRSFGTVESVKAVSELFMPVSGEVLDVNRELQNTPENVNTDPYGTGWMIRIRLSDPGQAASLMTADKYDDYTADKG
jgi:glycine cleavage system H protein